MQSDDNDRRQFQIVTMYSWHDDDSCGALVQMCEHIPFIQPNEIEEKMISLLSSNNNKLKKIYTIEKLGTRSEEEKEEESNKIKWAANKDVTSPEY